MSSKRPSAISRAKSDLVAVAYLLINVLKGDLEVLKAIFPLIYGEADYLLKFTEKVEAVDKLPTVGTRVEARKTARQSMVAWQKQQRILANRLTEFITLAYTPDLVPAKLVSSGISVYLTDANHLKWPAVKNLFNQMIAFVAANRVQLASAGSMYATFETDLTTLSEKFAADLVIFGDSNGMSQSETDTVRTAIADLNKQVNGVLANARAAFYDNEAKRTYYVYSNLQRIAVPARNVGGIRFGIMDAVSSRPIKGAVASTPYFGITVTSNSKGRVTLQPMPNNVYKVQIVAEGYPIHVLNDVVVQKSRMTTLKDVLLQPLPMGMTRSSAPVVHVVAEVLEDGVVDAKSKVEKQSAAVTAVSEPMPTVVEVSDVDTPTLTGVQ